MLLMYTVLALTLRMLTRLVRALMMRDVGDQVVGAHVVVVAHVVGASIVDAHTCCCALLWCAR